MTLRNYQRRPIVNARPECGSDESRKPWIDLDEDSVCSLTFRVMCHWHDGQPLGAMDFMGTVIDVMEVGDCDLLKYAARNVKPRALLLVQSECPFGSCGACETVAHESGCENKRDSIALDGRIENGVILAIDVRLPDSDSFIDAYNLYNNCGALFAEALVGEESKWNRILEGKKCSAILMMQAVDEHVAPDEFVHMVYPLPATNDVIAYYQEF